MPQIAVIDLISDVAQVCREAPTTTLVSAYIRAVRRFCQRSHWFRASLPGVTQANVQQYSLGSDVYNEIIGVRAVSLDDGSGSETARTALTDSNSGTWDSNLGASVGNLPELYQYVPEGQIALHPTPAGAYNLRVTLILQPKRGSNSIDDTLPVKWGYAFDAGALAYLLDLPRVPWIDKVTARARELEFLAATNSARSSAERGYNAGAATTSRMARPSGALHTRILPI